MKKMISVVAALAMALTMSLSVFAVPSVEIHTAPDIIDASDADDKELDRGDLIVTPVKEQHTLPKEKAEKLEEVYQEIKNATNISAFLEKTGLTDEAKQRISEAAEQIKKPNADGKKPKVKLENMAVQAIFDASAYGTIAEALEITKQVSITFAVPGLRADQVAIVLHLGQKGWEVVPSVSAKGQVTATFTDLSPVVILVEKEEGDVVPSPQTGNIEFGGILMVSAVICAAGLVYALKRRSRA